MLRPSRIPPLIVLALACAPSGALAATSSTSTSPQQSVEPIPGQVAPAPATTTAPPTTLPPASETTTPATGTTAPPPSTSTSSSTTTAPALTPQQKQALANAQSEQQKKQRRTSGLAIAAIVLAVILLLTFLFWALWRIRGWDPRWMRRWRHATAEAGWRLGLGWAEFRDFLHLGR